MGPLGPHRLPIFFKDVVPFNFWFSSELIKDFTDPKFVDQRMHLDRRKMEFSILVFDGRRGKWPRGPHPMEHGVP